MRTNAPPCIRRVFGMHISSPSSPPSPSPSFRAQLALASRRSRRPGHSSSKSWARPAGSVLARPIRDRYHPFFISVPEGLGSASVTSAKPTPITPGIPGSRCAFFSVRRLGRLKNNRSSRGPSASLRPSSSLSPVPRVSLCFPSPSSAGFPHGSERDARGETRACEGRRGRAAKGPSKELGVETRYRGRLNG